MDKEQNQRAPAPLAFLIEFWEKHLGEDDELNPPNLLGEMIGETLFYLKGYHTKPSTANRGGVGGTK